MKKVFASIILLFLVTATLKAQNISTISGKVVNKTNEPLMGNVLVLSPTD
jgi:hypothetical protein